MEAAFAHLVRVKGWELLALNIRTEHVHVVVAAPDVSPDRVVVALKAYGTKALRDAGLVGADEVIWARHASTRYLWKSQHVAGATNYVANWQGGDLPGAGEWHSRGKDGE